MQMQHLAAEHTLTRFCLRSLPREVRDILAVKQFICIDCLPPVCHSDIELLSGATLDTRRYVLGHESCGIAVK
jgi:hypothetical protein